MRDRHWSEMSAGEVEKYDRDELNLSRREVMGASSVVAAAAAIGLMPRRVAAQSGPTDEISGTVTDSNGAVDGATVDAVPHDSSLDVLRTTTDANGDYLFNDQDLHGGANLYHVICRDGTETSPRRGQENYPFISAEGTAIPDSVDNHWPIDEGSGTTLTDSEGSRDFSVVGASWDGSDLLLDGTDDYAEESNDDGYFAGLDDFSVFGWFNANAFPSNATLACVYDTSSADRSWEILIENSGGDWRLNTSADGSNVTNATATDTFATSEWHSFAFTRRASDGQVEFYQDASSVGTGTGVSGTLHATTAAARFGARTSGGLNWDGYIKAFAFAKGHLLTATEIQELHDATDPR